ncbi:MAG: hypothetical protein WC833_03210 [Bacteroidales bacterium]|jgi:hypothetical protein
MDNLYPEFEGYSPAEMHMILYSTFEESSPIQLQKLSEVEYNKIPIFLQVRHIAQTLLKDGEIRLTAVGNLPMNIVAELYPLGVSDWFIESGKSKYIREQDSLSVQLARILIEQMGVAKKRNNVLSLTKAGAKIFSDYSVLLPLLMETFGRRFNWAYFDAFGENNIGQLGFGFSLDLIGKYGSVRRADKFYADKYFAAFPMLLEGLVPSFGTLGEYATSCYSIRTFDRFLLQLGLVEIEEEKNPDGEKTIVKTEIFDKLFKFVQHN